MHAINATPAETLFACANISKSLWELISAGKIIGKGSEICALTVQVEAIINPIQAAAAWSIRHDRA